MKNNRNIMAAALASAAVLMMPAMHNLTPPPHAGALFPEIPELPAGQKDADHTAVSEPTRKLRQEPKAGGADERDARCLVREEIREEAMIGVFLCSPTNSQPFTNCCEVAICDHEPVCPRCKEEVYPGRDVSNHERRTKRWQMAYGKQKRGARS